MPRITQMCLNSALGISSMIDMLFANIMTLTPSLSYVGPLKHVLFVYIFLHNVLFCMTRSKALWISISSSTNQRWYLSALTGFVKINKKTTKYVESVLVYCFYTFTFLLLLLFSFFGSLRPPRAEAYFTSPRPGVLLSSFNLQDWI